MQILLAKHLAQKGNTKLSVEEINVSWIKKGLWSCFLKKNPCVLDWNLYRCNGMSGICSKQCRIGEGWLWRWSTRSWELRISKAWRQACGGLLSYSTCFYTCLIFFTTRGEKKKYLRKRLWNPKHHQRDHSPNKISRYLQSCFPQGAIVARNGNLLKAAGVKMRLLMGTEVPTDKSTGNLVGLRAGLGNQSATEKTSYLSFVFESQKKKISFVNFSLNFSILLLLHAYWISLRIYPYPNDKKWPPLAQMLRNLYFSLSSNL